MSSPESKQRIFYTPNRGGIWYEALAQPIEGTSPKLDRVEIIRSTNHANGLTTTLERSVPRVNPPDSVLDVADAPNNSDTPLL